MTPKHPKGSPPDPRAYLNDRGTVVKGRLAEDIISDHPFRVMKDNKEIYYYEGGVFHRDGGVVVKAEAQARLGPEHSGTHALNGVETYVRHHRQIWVPRAEFNKSPDVIAVENGVLNTKTGELTPHSPDALLTIKIPVTFNPKARCPGVIRFLGEVLRPTDVSLVQEFIGYCLYHGYPYQKAFMLLGAGANGKGTLLRLIKRLLGKDNVVATSLQVIGEHKYAKARLDGKLANLGGDLPSKRVKESAVFKELTGGDLTYGEHKYCEGFEFVNHAKMIFSANQLPPTSDTSDAWFRRWVIIDFPNRFEGDANDPFIIDRITTERELSGLLNWALEGLAHLHENGGFSDNLTTEEVKEDYLRRSEPIAAFLKDMCVVGRGKEVSKEELRHAYDAYASDHRLPPIHETQFTPQLRFYVPDLDTKKGHAEGGGREWRYTGVALRRKDPGSDERLEGW